MDRLAQHRAYLEAEWRAAQAAPLSARKAMLVASLVDAYVDRLFAAGAAEDVLAFRAAAVARSVALGRIIAVCGQQASVRLVTEAVPVKDYGVLPVEDFMVSLYNNHTVQRVFLVTSDGRRHDIHETLREGIAALDREVELLPNGSPAPVANGDHHCGNG